MRPLRGRSVLGPLPVEQGSGERPPYPPADFALRVGREGPALPPHRTTPASLVAVLSPPDARAIGSRQRRPRPLRAPQQVIASLPVKTGIHFGRVAINFRFTGTESSDPMVQTSIDGDSHPSRPARSSRRRSCRTYSAATWEAAATARNSEYPRGPRPRLWGIRRMRSTGVDGSDPMVLVEHLTVAPDLCQPVAA